jgi:hypothetical protein
MMPVKEYRYLVAENESIGTPTKPPKPAEPTTRSLTEPKQTGMPWRLTMACRGMASAAKPHTWTSGPSAQVSGSLPAQVYSELQERTIGSVHHHAGCNHDQVHQGRELRPGNHRHPGRQNIQLDDLATLGSQGKWSTSGAGVKSSPIKLPASSLSVTPARPPSLSTRAPAVGATPPSHSEAKEEEDERINCISSSSPANSYLPGPRLGTWPGTCVHPPPHAPSTTSALTSSPGSFKSPGRSCGSKGANEGGTGVSPVVWIFNNASLSSRGNCTLARTTRSMNNNNTGSERI